MQTTKRQQQRQGKIVAFVLCSLMLGMIVVGAASYKHVGGGSSTNCATVADNQVGSAPGPAWNAAYDACVSSEKFMGNR